MQASDLPSALHTVPGLSALILSYLSTSDVPCSGQWTAPLSAQQIAERTKRHTEQTQTDREKVAIRQYFRLQANAGSSSGSGGQSKGGLGLGFSDAEFITAFEAHLSKTVPVRIPLILPINSDYLYIYRDKQIARNVNSSLLCAVCCVLCAVCCVLCATA